MAIRGWIHVQRWNIYRMELRQTSWIWKSKILALVEYWKDFDQCVTLYKDFIQQWEDVPELKMSDVSKAEGMAVNAKGKDIELYF